MCLCVYSFRQLLSRGSLVLSFFMMYVVRSFFRYIFLSLCSLSFFSYLSVYLLWCSVLSLFHEFVRSVFRSFCLYVVM